MSRIKYAEENKKPVKEKKQIALKTKIIALICVCVIAVCGLTVGFYKDFKKAEDASRYTISASDPATLFGSARE
ncbi:hypothetical protein [Anaerolentibacter hominis]|uniref:hypothetical protein n=1 Tax=Anaerolentibacter hominis TaxID=3079009 RepID=UPI0031B84DBF